MKNKIIKFLTVVTVISFALFTLIACNGSGGTEPSTPPEHVCEYGAWTSNGDGTHTRVCVENSTHSQTEDCSGGAATETEKAVCEVCGSAYGTTLTHTHVYDKQNTAEKFLTSSATCQQKAKYYYSCDCGEKGVDAFEYGDLATHVYESDKCKWCQKEKVVSQGLEYTLINNETEYKVSGVGNCTDMEIIIPSVYAGKPVTSIGNGAFYNCSSLTSIEIPNGVTSIGYDVFTMCMSLTNIDVDNNNTAYKSIDGNLYSKDEKTLIQYAIGKTATSFSIPNNVTNIGESAFKVCISLTSIEIPNSVTSIGDYAFFRCRSLTSIEIPNGVTSIGNSAFYDCSSLTSVTFAENSQLTSIGNSAFYGCSSLTSIEIPNSVTSIGEQAFSSCSSLTSIEIPNSVTSVGNNAFINSFSLVSINVDSNNTAYKSIDGNLYSKDGKTLIKYAVGKIATSFTIPNSVTSVGEFAFQSCDSLESITFEEDSQITNIGVGAFYFCSSLTSIEIPNGVTSIGNSAFYECSSLTSIEIPNSVTSIGGQAFTNCRILKNIGFKGTVDDWRWIEHGYWNHNVPATEVICTDGKVAL